MEGVSPSFSSLTTIDPSLTPQNIPVVLSGCPLIINHNQHNKRRRETRGVNYNNLISIQITKAKTTQNRATLPIICCLNARSLNGKVDELAAFMSVHKVHIATVTETWFTDQIGDDQLSIGGYVIYRKAGCIVAEAEYALMSLSRYNHAMFGTIGLKFGVYVVAGSATTITKTVICKCGMRCA